jgi:hypothetical protein
MIGGVFSATRSVEECFFFDIDVKGGERSRVRNVSGAEESLNGQMQRSVESKCKYCHQCQRGRLLANSVNRQRKLVIDGKYNIEDDRQTEDKFKEVNDRKQ